MSNVFKNYADETTGAGGGVNVLGNTRAVKGTQTDSGTDSAAQPTSGSTTPATITPGQSSTQVGQSQQPQQSNKQAGSGMFTNIKSYVEKNQPAAQKMAGAVSKNIGDQASQIREQTEKKAQIQKEALAANQNTLTAAGDFATKNIQNVIGEQPQTPPATSTQTQQNQTQTEAPEPAPEVDVPPAPVVPEMSDEDIARMQDLYRGEVQGLTQVADLNLAQQQAKIQALQNMAQGANTEQGRMNLLKNTFGNQGQTQYTRGLSGLDQLIVSGDQAAREQLVSGTQGQAQGIAQDVQGIQQGISTQRQLQGEALKVLRSDIQDQINKGVLDIETDLTSAITQEKADREKYFPFLLEAQEKSQQELDSLKKVTSTLSKINNLSQKNYLGSSGNGYQGDFFVKELKSFVDTGDPSALRSLTNKYGNNAMKAAGLGEYTGEDGLYKLSNMLKNNTLGVNYSSNWNDLGKTYTDTSNPIDKFLNESNFSMDQIQNMTDLTRENVSTQDQRSRFNMLKKFMGSSDIISPENNTPYLSSLQLKDLLKQYGIGNTESEPVNINTETGPRKTT